MPESKNPFDNDIKQIGRYKYTDPNRFSSRIANERYTAMILDSLDLDGKVVVDVGCGDGTYTADLAELSNAKFIFGIDPVASAIERARTVYEQKYKNIKFEVGTSSDLVAAGRRFSVAIYRGALHHIDNPKREIQNALRLATEILFLEPNGLNMMMKIAECISNYHREHDERSFTHCRVEHWIKAYHGKVEEIRFFGLVPYFCPDVIARTGRFLEPVMERIPLLKIFYCGQYVLVASSSDKNLNSLNRIGI